jgi:hypothetical protein
MYELIIDPDELTERRIPLEISASDVQRLRDEGVFTQDETPTPDEIAYHLCRCHLVGVEIGDSRWTVIRDNVRIGGNA